ncbi:uncharacterized protein LOC121875316 [Homarus americanus]|uniref:uncharacterized protein LOC121875316 n=1 Tax=Homarus americanus TaxID=6706 RepID=UPI001C44781F|nr:uncharacterized protein LOC121875316 [Homarus americanus]
MNFCLHPQLTTTSSDEDDEDDDDDEDEEWFSPTSSSPSSSSCALGDSEVFLQESAFGSFTSPPGEPEGPGTVPSPRRLRFRSSTSSWSSYHSSSSSDLGHPTRRGSVKRFFQRPLSVLRSLSWGEKELDALSCAPSTSLLQEFTDALLHVYRTNTFPPEGLQQFHEKLAVLVMGGGGGLALRWWQSEVVPGGTRMLAVRVASPLDGDRLTALVAAWRSLYTSTLPLLLALLAPINNLDVRGDVLSAFRDTVVPYADLPAIRQSQPKAFTAHAWTLKQMTLLLASLGPCTCDLLGGKEAGGRQRSREGDNKDKPGRERERRNIVRR